MRVKVSEASGPVLDWMVAKCEDELDRCDYYLHESTGAFMLEHGEVSIVYSPSTRWAQGGPIIEQAGISLWNKTNSTTISSMYWNAKSERYVHSGFGPAPLIAAMRCYCASRLGEIVEVPDELA